MSWILFALIAATATAFCDVISKILMKKDDAIIVAWMRAVFIVPFVLIGLFLLGPYRVTKEFWCLAFIIIPLDIAAFIIYLKAIRSSALSLTLPFLAFSPIFVILNSRLILGEQVSKYGFIGIGLIVLGSYILNVKKTRENIFEPFFAVFREPGPRLMLVAAFIYGLDAVLGKKMMRLSEPKFFAMIYPVFLFISLTPIVFYRIKRKITGFHLNFNRFLLYFLNSFIFAVVIVAHFKAVLLTQTAYAIALKRTSILFGSVLGFLLFKEKNIQSRLAGVGLMLAGVLMIGFYA